MDDRFAIAAAAARTLPAEPLGGRGADLEFFDVALALDIEPPLRRCQDYFWLETMATTPQDALEIARSWAERCADQEFEVTGMPRRRRTLAAQTSGRAERCWLTLARAAPSPS